MEMALRDKFLIVLGLSVLILNLSIIPIVFTGAVPSAVEERFETYPLDSVCGVDGDCSSIEEEWSSSSVTRDYYAWDLTNLNDVLLNQELPQYNKKGPYTYEITSEKTFLNHDEEAGELTYNVVNSFECSLDSLNSCDEELTQLNIQFRPQTIGATSSAINGIMELTKIGFASGMLNQDLNTTQAGIATSDFIEGMTDVVGGAGFGTYAYTALGTAEVAGQVNVIQSNVFDGSLLPAANFLGGLESALYSSFHPLDEQFNISLLTDMGPVAFVSMGEPELLLSQIEADPENSIAVKRATAYGYLATEMIDTNDDGNEDELVIDYAQTFVRDWSLYVAIGFEFLSNGGGSSFTDSEDIANRLNNLLGIDFSEIDCLNLMMNGDGGSTPLGLLAKNLDGTSFGLNGFLDMDSNTAMTIFGLSYNQYEGIFNWANNWASSSNFFHLALVGGSGTVNAKEFVNTTFGNEDPINGGYLEYSLNQGGNWGESTFSPLSLTNQQSAEILYGEYGITTTSGAILFLYGELSGQIPPGYLQVNSFSNNWDDDAIAFNYNLDLDTAKALREFIVDSMFGEFVESFLINNFNTQPYLTQSVNSWLIGWHDPVSAYLVSGDSTNMSVGWASLESNKTYFGSNEILNGDGTNYTICTGENPSCDKGELIEQDGSSQLSWRNEKMFTGTLGILTPEEISGTTGGFLTGIDDKVDVSGYAIAEISCNDEDVLKGIPVNVCNTTVKATERLIQANLLKTFSLLDVIPSALPIYLGSDIVIKSEQISGLIIAGESTTRFYLDSRVSDNMKTNPEMDDLTPVFEIKSSSVIGDKDAEEMKSAIVQNQNHFTYWMNLDTKLDFIPMLLWVIAISCGIIPFILNVKGLNEFEELDAYSTDEKPNIGLLELAKKKR